MGLENVAFWLGRHVLATALFHGREGDKFWCPAAISIIILSLMNFLSCCLHCLFPFKLPTCLLTDYFECLLYIFQVLCYIPGILSCFPQFRYCQFSNSFCLYTLLANESTLQNFIHCLCRMNSSSNILERPIPGFLSAGHCPLVAPGTSIYLKLSQPDLVFPFPVSEPAPQSPLF